MVCLNSTNRTLDSVIQNIGACRVLCFSLIHRTQRTRTKHNRNVSQEISYAGQLTSPEVPRDQPFKLQPLFSTLREQKQKV